MSQNTKQRLYLDNAATSFPKPNEVHDSMLDYATRLGASPGRGAYAEAKEAGELLQDCRERLCRLFKADESKPEQIIFTLNTSDALNLGIRGILTPLIHKQASIHVITTDMDHNSILRPFNELAKRGQLTQTRVKCDPKTGLVKPEAIQSAIQEDTRLIAVIHGSNVSGTIQPIAQIGQIAQSHDIPFLVDAAQSAGHLPIDVNAMQIDLLAFPGHKGLLGPLGTGGLYIHPKRNEQLWTVREGGTGSKSELDTQPVFLPDRYEPGSHNAIGLIGLNRGLAWLENKTIEKLWQHEYNLIELTLEQLSDERRFPGLKLFGPKTVHADPNQTIRCGVFSIRIEDHEDPVELSQVMEKEFGLLTRSGIHCAPGAHQTFGTHQVGGTTRFSYGPYTTESDVQRLCDAISKICCASPAGFGSK